MNNVRNADYLYLFGKNLKKIRKQKGLSQANLAYDANIPVNQVGRIERGEINTTVSSLVAIANALGIEVGELFSF